MPDGHVLELATIPTRHPLNGDALLHVSGPPTVFRLSMDPPPLPSGTMYRSIEVAWVRHPGGGPAEAVSRAVGWSGLPDSWAELCVQLRYTLNEQDVTEQAAIGVMALLVSDLEQGVLGEVLPIGSGGDYYVVIAGRPNPVQIECSGVRADLDGSASRGRVNEKWDHVLTKGSRGFVAVTTFAHRARAVVHSDLHFVRQPRARRTKRGK